MIHLFIQHSMQQLYLHQILRSIEQKTPMIAAQRRDYHRILESHTQLSKRLDDVIMENSYLKEEVEKSKTRMEKSVREAISLDQLNKDLGAQVQFLLKKGHSDGKPHRDGTNATDVISDYLVTFENVQELQQKNMQLLQITRKLAEDQERCVYV